MQVHVLYSYITNITLHVCIYIYINRYIHIYIYIYIIYIYTCYDMLYIYIYIYTCTQLKYIGIVITYCVMMAYVYVPTVTYCLCVSLLSTMRHSHSPESSSSWP